MDSFNRILEEDKKLYTTNEELIEIQKDVAREGKIESLLNDVSNTLKETGSSLFKDINEATVSVLSLSLLRRMNNITL